MRLTKWAVAFAACAAASGCVFNTDVQGNTIITCDNAGRTCPRGFVCQGDGQEAICVPDVGGKLVITAVPRQGMAKRGDVVLVDVTSNLPLGTKPPRVFSTANTWSSNLDLVSKENDEGTVFVFSLLVNATAPDGTHELRADATAGPTNKIFNAPTGGFFQVDSETPRVTVGTTIDPNVVAPRSKVTVSVATNEPVRAQARLLVRPKLDGGTERQYAPVRQLLKGLVYSFDIPADEATGTYALTVDGLTDEAGNVALPEDTGVGDLYVLAEPPLIGPLELAQVRRRSAVSPFNKVPVTVDVKGAQGEITVTFRDRTERVQATKGPATLTTVEFTVLPSDPEGTWPVTVTARNEARTSQSRSEDVLVDHTPPRLDVSSSLPPLLKPPAGCPLSVVTAATSGATVQAIFNVTEPLSNQPTVSAGSLVFSNPAPVSGAVHFEFEGLVPQGLANGTRTVDVVLVDEVGNSATETLGTFAVDQIPPTPLQPAQLAGVLLTRNPWGSESTQGAPRMTLGADAGAFEPHAVVFAYDGPTTLSDRELGRATAGPAGQLAQLALPSNDVVNVYVSQVDQACNRDSPTGTRLSQGEWVATLGKKVLGSTFENPHSFVQAVSQDSREYRATFAVEGGPQVARVDAQRVGSDSDFLVSRYSGFRFHEWADGPALVWDEFMGKLVVIPGGSGTIPFVGLWDGHQLAVRVDGFSPAGGTNPNGAFYDSTLRRVLFTQWSITGGQETLAWNGVALERIHVSSTLTSRDQVATAYDEVNKRGIFFGGRAPGPLNATFTWDGTTWTQVPTADAGTAPARFGHRMVYDTFRNRIRMFGGVGAGNVPLDDVWEWTGSAWESVTTTGQKPTGRAYFGMGYDTDRHVTVIAAGAAVTQSGFVFDTGETFELDSNNVWTKLPPSAGAPKCGTQANSPGSYSAAMAYDKVRQTMVLSCDRRFWEWKGGRWSYRGHARNVEEDLVAEGVAGAYDTVNKRTISFNGTTTSYRDNDRLGAMWLFTDEPTYLPNAGAPSNIGCVAYSAHNQSLVALRWTGSAHETHTWDGGEWATATTPPQVSGWWGCSMAYDPIRQRVVKFENGNGTWEWTGSAWVDVTPMTPSPPHRNTQVLYFDADAGAVVMFGGGPQGDPTVNDTWQWSGTEWTQRITTGGPTDNYQEQRGVYDTKRGVFVLAHYVPNTNNIARIWELAGTTWTDVTPPGDFYFPTNGLFVYDERLGGVHARGCCNGPNYDSYLWTGKEVRRISRTRHQVPARGSIAYDAARQNSVVFTDAETWTWDGSTWVNRTDWSTPTPAERQMAAMAYDPTTQSVVLYGGVPGSRFRIAQFEDAFSDTWVWSGSPNPVWTQVIDGGAPPGPRVSPTMVFDPRRSRIVLIGGSPNGASGPYEWVSDAGTWAPVGSAPTAINAHGAYGVAFEPNANRMLLFGGAIYGGAGWDPSSLLNSTGLWEASGYQSLGGLDPRLAGGFRDYSLAYEPRRGKTFLMVSGAEDPVTKLPAMPSIEFSSTNFFGAFYPMVGTPFRINESVGGRGVFDEGRNMMVLQSDYAHGVQEFGNPREVVPVHEIAIEKVFAGLPDNVTISRVTAHAVAGASGSGPSGARLDLWNGVSWEPVTTGTASAATPEALDMTITDATQLARLWSKRQLVFRISPRTENSGTAPARLVTDYAEVRVRYTLP